MTEKNRSLFLEDSDKILQLQDQDIYLPIYENEVWYKKKCSCNFTNIKDMWNKEQLDISSQLNHISIALGLNI